MITWLKSTWMQTYLLSNGLIKNLYKENVCLRKSIVKTWVLLVVARTCLGDFIFTLVHIFWETQDLKNFSSVKMYFCIVQIKKDQLILFMHIFNWFLVTFYTNTLVKPVIEQLVARIEKKGLACTFQTQA